MGRFVSVMGASLTGSGLGNTRGDLENCEWTEGDDVTSGLNFCGVFGGVATAIYGFDLLPFSFLQNVCRWNALTQFLTYWYLTMFLFLFCFANFRLTLSWS